MNKYFYSFLFSTLTILCMSASNEDKNPWENHPLWVGYNSSENGRTPELSGLIDLDYISEFMPAQALIVEAGAFNGEDTFKLSRRWPDALIYAFEPMPYAFDLLKKKCKRLPNVYLFPLALGEKEGPQTLYLSSGASLGSSSLLPPSDIMKMNHDDVVFEESAQVMTITLDAWSDREGVPTIDFLWLDLQGMEPNVLRASPKILANTQIIFSEVNLEEVYTGCICYKEFKQWLNQEGFIVVREDLPWKDGGNVLFVRETFLQTLK